MAAPLEVIISSDSGSQLWNTTVFDLHSGSSLLSYRGGNSSARALTVLGGQFLLSAQLGKNFINVWEIQRKVRAVAEHTLRHTNTTEHTCCMSCHQYTVQKPRISPEQTKHHQTFFSKTKCTTCPRPAGCAVEFGVKIVHHTSLNFV